MKEKSGQAEKSRAPKAIKTLNFGFFYFTLICTFSSVPYYGLDYIITKPLGFVHQDRSFGIESREATDFKPVLETSFLYTRASDQNTRIKRGKRGRAERWKTRLDKFRVFDASLYDEGIYDLFNVEDLNYGFDKFWLRRTKRVHVPRFRVIGSYLFKLRKQFSFMEMDQSNIASRYSFDFFRMLFEQAYDPIFHDFAALVETKVHPGLGVADNNNLHASVRGETKKTIPFGDLGKGSTAMLCSSGRQWLRHGRGSFSSSIAAPFFPSGDYPLGSRYSKFSRKFSTRISSPHLKSYVPHCLSGQFGNLRGAARSFHYASH